MVEKLEKNKNFESKVLIIGFEGIRGNGIQPRFPLDLSFGDPKELTVPDLGGKNAEINNKKKRVYKERRNNGKSCNL